MALFGKLLGREQANTFLTRELLAPPLPGWDTTARVRCQMYRQITCACIPEYLAKLATSPTTAHKGLSSYDKECLPSHARYVGSSSSSSRSPCKTSGPAAISSRKRYQGSSNSTTRRAPRSKLPDCATGTSTSPPPRKHDCHSEANLGWICSLGKTARFAEPDALPPGVPHRGTKLGGASSEKEQCT